MNGAKVSKAAIRLLNRDTMFSATSLRAVETMCVYRIADDGNGVRAHKATRLKNKKRKQWVVSVCMRRLRMNDAHNRNIIYFLAILNEL